MTAQCLLQVLLEDEFLQTQLDMTSQKLVEKEIKDVVWTAIRASAKWAQIDARMDESFFA